MLKGRERDLAEQRMWIKFQKKAVEIPEMTTEEFRGILFLGNKKQEEEAIGKLSPEKQGAYKKLKIVWYNANYEYALELFGDEISEGEFRRVYNMSTDEQYLERDTFSQEKEAAFKHISCAFRLYLRAKG